MPERSPKVVFGDYSLNCVPMWAVVPGSGDRLAYNKKSPQQTAGRVYSDH